jgi:hypothetical protein
MRLKHVVSLAAACIGIGITAGASADTSGSGYVCDLSDNGGWVSFQLTQGKFCEGTYEGFYWYLTPASGEWAGQFDRLQRAMYAQNKISVDIGTNNVPSYFSYYPN